MCSRIFYRSPTFSVYLSISSARPAVPVTAALTTGYFFRPGTITYRTGHFPVSAAGRTGHLFASGTITIRTGRIEPGVVLSFARCTGGTAGDIPCLTDAAVRVVRCSITRR